MKRKSEQLSANSLIRRSRNGSIVVNSTYQREIVWTKPQNQLLIDSVLQNIDIPKIYLLEVEENKKWEIVDGQQRLNAIVSFADNEFELSKDTDIKEWRGKKYSDFDEKTIDRYESYQFSVVILENASEDDIKDMFLRLQNGTTLNAAEKRNVMPGNMAEFVRNLAEHPFFESCQVPNKRRAHDQIVAQITCLELAGGTTPITGSALVNMYKRQRDFNVNSAPAKSVRRILNMLAEAFPQETPEISRHNVVISLFLLFRELDENFAIKDRLGEIADWFVNKFEVERAEDLKKETEKRDEEFLTYQAKTGNSTDNKESLDFRRSFLLQKCFDAIPDLKPLDSLRQFTEQQRIVIWRRDRSRCQVKLKCDGKKSLLWNNWEADHKVPFSKGGETTVANGQVACIKCNRAKSDKS